MPATHSMGSWRDQESGSSWASAVSGLSAFDHGGPPSPHTLRRKGRPGAVEYSRDHDTPLLIGGDDILGTLSSANPRRVIRLQVLVPSGSPTLYAPAGTRSGPQVRRLPNVRVALPACNCCRRRTCRCVLVGEVTHCREVPVTPHQLSAHFGVIVPTSTRPLDSGQMSELEESGRG
jgi:hypothetical protein